MNGLNLPEYDRVVFDEAPLEEVVFQGRFHRILKIGSSDPVDFQEQIRHHFPVMQQEQGVRLDLADNRPAFAALEGKRWQFLSSNERWSVTLTNEFLALKTTGYTDFENFLENLLPVLQAFEASYAPPFYTRIGLRYVNRIFRARVEKQRIDWGEVLNPLLSQKLLDPVIGDAIIETAHYSVLKGEQGQIGWRYSRDIGRFNEEPAERFTLDFDHYLAGEVECAKVHDLLVGFNDTVYRLFRWLSCGGGFKRQIVSISFYKLLLNLRQCCFRHNAD